MSKHAKALLILAVPNDTLSVTKDLGNTSTFAPMDSDAALAQLGEAGAWFGPRPILEDDPRFRQIIPYVVLRCGDRFLTYTRGGAGGESRLHEKISMGFGGHVDLPDMQLGDDGLFDLGATLRVSVEREIEEEIPGVTITGKNWVGLVADNTNDVGRVHVGLIGIWDIEAIPETSGEDAILSLSGLDVAELKGAYDRLENWSKILVDNIDAF